MEIASLKRHQARGGARRRGRTAALLLGLLALSCLGTFLLTARYLGSERLEQWAHLRGHQVMSRIGLARALSTAPGRLLGALSAGKKVPDLVLDIKFIHLEKLNRKRAEALARGFLFQADGDFVPAAIRRDGRLLRAELRLKGDLPDHLLSDRWSLRIHLKGDEHYLGLRRFSIQHPGTRAYQAEALFLDWLRQHGVLAPRYFFVNLIINGRGIGLMALEEHFSKELLEAQGRAESVIIRFDESLFWEEWAATGRKGTVFNSYKNVPIDAFESAKVAASQQLGGYQAAAVGLLRGFVEGRLKPSKVFDALLTGRFLAAAELWGARHSLFWNNLRFYYNPVTAKLEPIGFDCFRRLITDPVQALVSAEEPIVRDLLSDERIFSAYLEALRSMAAELEAGVSTGELRAREREYREILHREFFLLEAFPFARLAQRAKLLLSLVQIPPASYPDLLASASSASARELEAIAHARLVEDDGRRYLELASAVPQAVEVQRIQWISEEHGGALAFQARPSPSFPLRLPPTGTGELPELLHIDYVPPSEGSLLLEVSANLQGSSRLHHIVARPYQATARDSPLPSSSLAEQLARHPFLRKGEDGRSLSGAAGLWRVDGSLILPEGYSLTLPAGTTLLFGPAEGIVARGPLYFHGSPEKPVRLDAQPQGGREGLWQGVAVLEAGGLSRWTHVTIAHTTGMQRGGWSLSGGVTFFRSDIHMSQCAIRDHRGEDALNLIHSRFRLEGLEVLDTASDALDSDFSEGLVSGCSFTNIGLAGGGDAVDISGSRVTVRASVFRAVADKALSVGENSLLQAGSLSIDQAGAAAVCKDGSRLTLSDSSIGQVELAALMAYIKKAEYGPAQIEAVRVRFDGEGRPAIAQTGSSILIDGTAVRQEELDVAALYESRMKSAFK